MAPDLSKRSTLTCPETREIFLVPYAGDAAPQFHHKPHTEMENAWSRQGGRALKLRIRPTSSRR